MNEVIDPQHLKGPVVVSRTPKTLDRSLERHPSKKHLSRRNLFERHLRRHRQEGIALMVVMVVFVVLYLVVFQLHFSTTMEEKMAQVRYGEVESAVSLHSTALYVITLLVEDLKKDLSRGGDAGAGGALPAGGGVERAAGNKDALPPGGGAGAGGSFNPITSPGGGGTSAHGVHSPR